jgi:hypothetical protein
LEQYFLPLLWMVKVFEQALFPHGFSMPSGGCINTTHWLDCHQELGSLMRWLLST